MSNDYEAAATIWHTIDNQNTTSHMMRTHQERPNKTARMLCCIRAVAVSVSGIKGLEERLNLVVRYGAHILIGFGGEAHHQPLKEAQLGGV